MNNKVCILFSLIGTAIFLLAFIIDRFYIKENFTPYVNGMVRPHIRNVRINVENFSGDTNFLLKKVIRKSGLYY